MLFRCKISSIEKRNVKTMQDHKNCFDSYLLGCSGCSWNWISSFSYQIQISFIMWTTKAKMRGPSTKIPESPEHTARFSISQSSLLIWTILLCDVWSISYYLLKCLLLGWCARRMITAHASQTTMGRKVDQRGLDGWPVTLRRDLCGSRKSPITVCVAYHLLYQETRSRARFPKSRTRPLGQINCNL